MSIKFINGSVKTIMSVAVTATVLVSSSAFAESTVIGQLKTQGTAGAYIDGDSIVTKDNTAKLVLSSGEAVLNIEKNSTVSVSTSPLTLKLSAGNSCINLGAGNGLDLVDNAGKVTTFSAKNNAAVAIAVDGDTLRFAEVVSCAAADYVAANAFVATTLGKVVVGAAVITGVVVVENNTGNDGDGGAAQASASPNQ